MVLRMQRAKLNIHGETNFINAAGNLFINENIVSISAVKFIIKLEDYKIKIPRIVMYNIAEEIEVKVNIELPKTMKKMYQFL